MMCRIKRKYFEFILYIFFGICTTAVNIFSYYVCTRLLRLSTISGTIIAWILAVLFAYLTNRKWVFKSETKKMKDIIREGTSFFVCRLFTGILDVFSMFVFVDILRFNDFIIKIVVNIVVILLNYIASKLVIFKKGIGYINNKNQKYVRKS